MRAAGPVDGSATGERRGRFAVRIGLLAALVGVLVAAASLLSVAGDCAGPPADAVCRHLVTTLSERMGVVAALVTVVAMLTMAGLAKLNASGRATRAPTEAQPGARVRPMPKLGRMANRATARPVRRKGQRHG